MLAPRRPRRAASFCMAVPAAAARLVCSRNGRQGPKRRPCKSHTAAPSHGATQVALQSATQPNRWAARPPTLVQQPDGSPTRSLTCINSTSATSRYPTPTSGSSEAPRLPSGASSRPSCTPGGRAGDCRCVQRYAQLDRHGCDASPQCAPCGTHRTPLFMQAHQLQPCLSCCKQATLHWHSQS